VEHFKINCVTCQASLSVRNEKLVGQIVACPRCGSMVEVSAPEEAVDVDVVGEVAPEQPGPATTSYQLLAWSIAGLVVVAAIAAVAVGMLSGDNSVESTSDEAVDIGSPIAKSPEPAPEVIDESRSTDLPNETPDLPDPVEVVDPEVVVTKSDDLAEPAADASPIVAQPDEPTANVPKIARRFDPLDFDPASLDLSTLNLTQADPPLVDEVAPAAERVEELAEIPSTMPSVLRSVEARVDLQSRDAEAQLALQVPALKAKSMPLVVFLRLVSRLSGVPVSVAPEQLLMAGVSPRHQISIDVNEASLGEALSSALAPLHLHYVVRGSQVIVVRDDAEKRRVIEYPIDDLLNDSTTAQILAEWVQRLVTPESWQPADGKASIDINATSLRIEQTQRVQYGVLLFLERLRLARKLPPKSRYPIEKLAGEPALAAIDGKLQAPTTFTFSHETSLDEIFGYWQAELDLPLLVDWPALAEEGLWPPSRVTCAIADRPWREALDQVLAPLGLSWRAVSGGAIEITSAAKVDEQPVLELYTLQRAPDDIEQVLSELRTLTESDDLRLTALLYDSTGNVLCALQPATAHRRILRWLVERQFFDVDGSKQTADRRE